MTSCVYALVCSAGTYLSHAVDSCDNTAQDPDALRRSRKDSAETRFAEKHKVASCRCFNLKDIYVVVSLFNFNGMY